MEDIVKKYKGISRNPSANNVISVKSHLPNPTESDYRKGYIYRYFVRSINDSNSPIYEVSNDDYVYLSNTYLYMGTKIKWRISGPIQSTNGEMNVSESNQVAVRLASEKIKNLKLYLPNLLQFHK